MKNLFIFTVAIISFNISFAKDKITTKKKTVTTFEEHPNKTDDQWLPRWAITFSTGLGAYSNSFNLGDDFLNQHYKSSSTNVLTDTFKSTISNPRLLNNQTPILYTGNFNIGYFWGKKRHWGIGTGINFSHFEGKISVDKFLVQYHDSNTHGNYISIISNREYMSNGFSDRNYAITEKININTINIPLLLKYRHQFDSKYNLKNKSKWGIAVDLGPFLNVSSSYNSTVDAKFSYEGIYTSFDKSQFDASPITSSSDPRILITAASMHDKYQGTDYMAYINGFNNLGYNVGLNKTAEIGNKNQEIKTAISYGFIFQPSFSYSLSYNTSLLFGGYFMYHYIENSVAQGYHLTENLNTNKSTKDITVPYNSIINGTKTLEITSYGINVGVRFLFGEKPDRDGDGLTDSKDRKCAFNWGTPQNGYCPDSDGDGVVDNEEDKDCIDVPGSKNAHGCPDKDDDGIKDSEDACITSKGQRNPDPELNGCSREEQKARVAKKYQLSAEDATKNNLPIETYFDVLEAHSIYFDFGKSEVLGYNNQLLDNAINILNNDPKVTIYISGHADSIGSYESNMKLSFARANAVKQYLVNKGILSDRIFIAGYGKEEPVTDNNTPENRAKNRRIEMKLLTPLPAKK